MELSALFTFGNKELFSHPRTAFLCSRKVPAGAYLPCYDWAIEQREKGHCVISGFHSPIEKDVFRYLAKGKQPIILVLARGLKSKWEQPILQMLNENRLLIISPFDSGITRATGRTCSIRNNLMLSMADEIVIGYARPGGSLEKTLKALTNIEGNRNKIYLYKI